MRHGIATLLICTLLVSSCATAPATRVNPAAKPANIKEWLALQSRSKRSAIAGALVGGLLGAASAAVSGGNGDAILRGALAGVVVGAVAGFAMGQHQDRLFAGRDLAIRQVGYDASQGYIARVEEVSFDPAQPKPGQTATLYVRYVVLGPDPGESIKVRVFRGLKYGDDYIFGAGPNEFDVPKGGGVIESKMQITLSKKATQGTYSLEALVEDSRGRFPQAVGTGALYIVGNQMRGAVSAAS
jgi:hypothetical protein